MLEPRITVLHLEGFSPKVNCARLRNEEVQQIILVEVGGTALRLKQLTRIWSGSYRSISPDIGAGITDKVETV